MGPLLNPQALVMALPSIAAVSVYGLFVGRACEVHLQTAMKPVPPSYSKSPGLRSQSWYSLGSGIEALMTAAMTIGFRPPIALLSALVAALSSDVAHNSYGDCRVLKGHDMCVKALLRVFHPLLPPPRFAGQRVWLGGLTSIVLIVGVRVLLTMAVWALLEGRERTRFVRGYRAARSFGKEASRSGAPKQGLEATEVAAAAAAAAGVGTGGDEPGPGHASPGAGLGAAGAACS